MRALKSITVVLAALTTTLVSTAAWSGGGHYHHHHHGSRVHLGFVFGGPLWYPAPVYSYPYVYPPAIIVPSTPRVYIERDDRVARESTAGYWYYCRESESYYPYVKECAGPWERVPAQPSAR